MIWIKRKGFVTSATKRQNHSVFVLHVVNKTAQRFIIFYTIKQDIFLQLVTFDYTGVFWI